MEDNRKIINLFNKYITNKATIAEMEELLNYIRSSSEDDYVAGLIEQSMFNNPELSQDMDREKRLAETHEALLKHISDQRSPKSKSFKIWAYIVTAATLLLISLLGVFLLKTMRQPSKYQYAIHAEDVIPGSNKAVLTLADGKRVELNKTKDGSFASESGIDISKTSQGELVYTVKGATNTTNKYNTIETPNGGQYQVTLQDGTKVWLNAASSIRYPASFAGNQERQVQLLSGEAYFEVAHDKTHPFVVKSPEQEITVLGTKFNINAYKDANSIITTLLEGSVRVNTGTLLHRTRNNQVALLKPGQRSANERGKLSIQPADTETAIAWKNGSIKFKDEDVRTVLKQVARWYDLQIRYDGDIPQDLFTGSIPRQSNLKTVLRMFEMIGINFRIEAYESKKTLVVTH